MRGQAGGRCFSRAGGVLPGRWDFCGTRPTSRLRAAVGCRLNRSKTKVTGRAGDQLAGAAAKRIAAALKVRVEPRAEGLEILGAGFGAAQASKVLDKYVGEVQVLATAVLKLESPLSCSVSSSSTPTSHRTASRMRRRWTGSWSRP